MENKSPSFFEKITEVKNRILNVKPKTNSDEDIMIAVNERLLLKEKLLLLEEMNSDEQARLAVLSEIEEIEKKIKIVDLDIKFLTEFKANALKNSLSLIKAHERILELDYQDEIKKYKRETFYRDYERLQHTDDLRKSASFNGFDIFDNRNSDHLSSEKAWRNPINIITKLKARHKEIENNQEIEVLNSYLVDLNNKLEALKLKV